MLLFNAQFKTKEEFDSNTFLQLIQKWLKSTMQSPKNTYQFSEESMALLTEMEKKTSDEIDMTSEDKVKTIHIIKTGSAIGVKVISNTDSDIHTSSYVLRDNIMTVQLSLDQKNVTLLRQDPVVHIPNLMKRIFWEEYVDTDGVIPTNDKALYLNKADVNNFVRPVLFSRTVEHLMPIVYVSSQASGRYALNTDVLASDLIGIAHVVVEGSPAVSEKVADLAKDLYTEDYYFPYAEDGAVEIYMPGGYTEILSPTKSLPYDVKNKLYRATTLANINPKYLFDSMKQAKVLEKYQNDSELTELFDSICNEKDAEVKVLNDKITELEETIRNLTTEKMNLEATKESMSKKFLVTEAGGDTEAVRLVCGEKELYDGEINDVVLKTLEKVVASMSSDVNMKESRKFHVLSNILAANMLTGQDEIIKKMLETALKDGSVSSDAVRQLSMYGFKVAHDKKHDKISFGDDDRYTTTVSKTPSDYRAGKNLVSVFTNTLFGF